MAWSWSSYDDFKDYVSPIEKKKQSFFQYAQSASLFEQQKMLFEAVTELDNGLQLLRKIKYSDNIPTVSNTQLENSRKIVWKIVYYGEQLLLYHKRLAQSHWANDFIYEKDIDDHWDRYTRNGRIHNELKKFIKATEKLWEGFLEITSNDSAFIIDEIDLPESLKTDFFISRNVFSVGLDEIGVLIAGRGLEGVLREIARIKDLKIKIKGKDAPACETDFNDLIEFFYRLRWTKDNSRFINNQIRSLLHYLRSIRNSEAHPTLDNELNQKNAREMAKIITKTANSIWKDGNRKRARFVDKTITKDW